MRSETRAALAVLRDRASLPGLCISCERAAVRRRFASAAATAVAEDPLPYPHGTIKSQSSEPIPTDARVIKPVYQLHAGVVLSRAPFLTRELTPFEKAFYLYQRRLNERLALPFMRYFYYKKGTPADVEWKRKYKERKVAARDIGMYRGYGPDAWNDELLIGAQESEPQWQVEQLLKDAEDNGDKINLESDKDAAAAAAPARSKKKVTIEKPRSRLSVADETGDDKSLDRMGWRTLYLLVKGEGDRWMFPSVRLESQEPLHTAAQKLLTSVAGPDMNTWIVGNAPVGHFAFDFKKFLDNEETSSKELGRKIFFMKARMIAGQANLRGNQLGLTDFKWLAKEEVEKIVTPQYWAHTKNMLSER